MGLLDLEKHPESLYRTSYTIKPYFLKCKKIAFMTIKINVKNFSRPNFPADVDRPPKQCQRSIHHSHTCPKSL